MRRLLILAILALALPLGGCEGLIGAAFFGHYMAQGLDGRRCGLAVPSASDPCAPNRPAP